MGGGRPLPMESTGEDNPTKVYWQLLNRAEGSTVFPQHDCLGHTNRLAMSMNLESRISDFSVLEGELEEPVWNAPRPAGRPPVSVVFGLFVVLAVFGSAAYILCFYLK